MKFFLRIIIIVFLIISCKSQKSTVEKLIDRYKEEGYTLGTTAPTKADNCNTVITVNKSQIKYDPINIDEEKFAEYKDKRTSIFFKFLPLRMKNRCQGVSPIILVEVIPFVF